MADGWSRVKRVVQLSYILALGTLVLTIITVYSVIAPFQPMHVKNVSLTPETVCPAQLVGVDGRTTLDPGKYQLTIDPLWIKMDGDRKVLDEAQVDGEVTGPITDDDTSEELVYVSPPETGEWLIRFDISVEGRRGILPRTQEIGVTTDNTLNVVDCGDSYTYEEFKKHD